MFICQDCGKTIGPHISPIKVVVEKRNKVYLNKGVESHGWEIVKELAICSACVPAPVPESVN